MNKYLKNNILEEDEDFVFINKEPGLLSIQDRFDPNKPHLKAILKEHYGDILTVHRLDQYTSGVVVYAKHAVAHKTASEIFESRNVIKEYTALTINAPSEQSGTIDEPLREHKTKRGTYIVSDLGKEAVTDYEVIKQWEGYSLLKVKIATGRTHQIRVHLAYIGCPLLVDPVYGYYDKYFLSSIKKKKVNLKKGSVETPLLKRTPLHSTLLSFQNPSTKKVYRVEAPIPKDIKAICYQLDKRYKSSEQGVG